MAETYVGLLATLDTKAEEASFIAQQLRQDGCVAWVIDVGLGGHPALEADCTRTDVLRAAGVAAESFTSLPKVEKMAVVASGAGQLLMERYRTGDLAGVIGLGGGQGSWICGSAMLELPIGLPKVLVTTTPVRTAERLASSDIVCFPSVTDIGGLNGILRPVLLNAAAAISGMALHSRPSASTTTMVGMTMFGITTEGAQHVRRRLQAAGLDVAIFHANGLGGATLERLTRGGSFAGVLDWTTTELADELVGGIASAGPARLEAAARAGIPQVVVPGAIDAVNFGEPNSVPVKYEGRLFYRHHPTATLMRTSASENFEIGALLATKLNETRAAAEVIVPTKGYSALDHPDREFFDPAADEAFVTGLRGTIRQGIQVRLLPYHINDQEFASEVAHAFLQLL